MGARQAVSLMVAGFELGVQQVAPFPHCLSLELPGGAIRWRFCVVLEAKANELSAVAGAASV